VGAAGDVNRDGYPDIVLGGTGAYGRIQVFSGKDQSVLHDWTTTHYADGFGSAVSGAGDVNADGYPDVLVGASEYSSATGYARIYSGKDGSELKTLFGKSGNDRFGLSVSGAGDVDGDGHADFIIGAEEAGNRNGYAVIYSGRDYSVICKLTGPAYYNKFGYRVSGGGDVNGDGLPDVVVANPYESPRPGGEVNVYSGVGLPLITDTHQVSVASSGVQTLTIDLGWWDHGRNYGLAGSFGNNPGFMIDDWWVQLNVDLYFGYTVFNPNVFPLSNSWGILDGKGRAQATFTAPNEPALVGLTVYHVCMVFRNQVDLVSPSVPVTFVP